MNDSTPVGTSEHQIISGHTRYNVYEHPPPANVTINFPQIFDHGLQQLSSSGIESISPLASSFSEHLLEGFHGYRTVAPPTEGQSVGSSQFPMPEYNNIPLFGKHYHPTMSKDDLVKTFSKIASSHFPSMDTSRLDTLFSEAFHTIEKETQSSASLSSR